MSRFANKLVSRRCVLRTEYRQVTAEVSEANEVLEDAQGMPSVADAEEAWRLAKFFCKVVRCQDFERKSGKGQLYRVLQVSNSISQRVFIVCYVYIYLATHLYQCVSANDIAAQEQCLLDRNCKFDGSATVRLDVLDDHFSPRAAACPRLFELKLVRQKKRRRALSTSRRHNASHPVWTFE